MTSNCSVQEEVLVESLVEANFPPLNKRGRWNADVHGVYHLKGRAKLHHMRVYEYVGVTCTAGACVCMFLHVCGCTCGGTHTTVAKLARRRLVLEVTVTLVVPLGPQRASERSRAQNSHQGTETLSSLCESPQHSYLHLLLPLQFTLTPPSTASRWSPSPGIPEILITTLYQLCGETKFPDVAKPQFPH